VIAANRIPLKRRIGLFDSDCLEVAGPESRLSAALPGFGVRPRMQPMAARLEALYALAREHELTMVFTHCCSAEPVRPGSHPGVLVVPLDDADRGWMARVGDCRLFNIEKRRSGASTDESFICRYFDAFQHNGNARRLLRLLDIPRWILFGHGFDLCVDSAAKGILSAGYQVHLLTDVLASSATGYGPYGTEASKQAILAYLKKIGVTTGTLAEVLAEYRSGEDCS
jgi:nicotinamidase-related amidase